MTLHGNWGSCSVVITGERRQLLWAVCICWELCLSQSGLGALRVQILGWLLFGVQKWKEMSVTKVTFVSNDFCLLGLLPSVKLTQGRQLASCAFGSSPQSWRIRCYLTRYLSVPFSLVGLGGSGSGHHYRCSCSMRCFCLNEPSFMFRLTKFSPWQAEVTLSLWAFQTVSSSGFSWHTLFPLP